jgi:hypothetical protein
MTSGTELELADPRGVRTATVTTLPFVDPNKDTPKG